MLLMPLYSSKAAALNAYREPRYGVNRQVSRQAREGAKGSRLSRIRANRQASVPAELLPKVPAKRLGIRANG